MNIIFDVDDTLYDQLVPFENAYKMVFGENHDIDVSKLYVLSRKHSDEVFHLTKSGEMGIREMHIYRITQAFLDLGIMISEDEALKFQEEYAGLQREIILDVKMERVLNYGKEKNLTMGVITNGLASNQGNKVKQLQLHKWINQKNVFISGEVNLSKPDTKLFELVARKMNLSPSETYYIGDSYDNDVIGAKKASWNAVWLNRRKKDVPNNTSIYPDYTVASGDELLDLVRELYEGCTTANRYD